MEAPDGAPALRVDAGDVDRSRLVLVLCADAAVGQPPVVSLHRDGSMAQTGTNGLTVDQVDGATKAVRAYFPPVAAGHYLVTADGRPAGEVTVPDAGAAAPGADCPSARTTDVTTVACGELVVLRWTIDSPVAAADVGLIDVSVLDGRSAKQLGFYRIDLSDAAPGRLEVTFGTRLPKAHAVTLVARELIDATGGQHALDGRAFVPFR